MTEGLWRHIIRSFLKVSRDTHMTHLCHHVTQILRGSVSKICFVVLLSAHKGPISVIGEPSTPRISLRLLIFFRWLPTRLDTGRRACISHIKRLLFVFFCLYWSRCFVRNLTKLDSPLRFAHCIWDLNWFNVVSRQTIIVFFVYYNKRGNNNFCYLDFNNIFPLSLRLFWYFFYSMQKTNNFF